MCGRLAAAVAAVVAGGVGRWDEAWTLTAATDRRFMAALRKWEADETTGTTAELRAAFDAHVEAWKQVSLLWKRRDE